MGKKILKMRDLVRFIASIDTAEDCKTTVKLVEKCPKLEGSGGYKTLCKKFKLYAAEERNTSLCDDKKEAARYVYNRLKCSATKKKIYRFSDDSLSDIAVEYMQFYVKDENGNDTAVMDQKWHWLVSVLAYIDIVHNKKQGGWTKEEYLEYGFPNLQKMSCEIKWDAELDPKNFIRQPVCYCNNTHNRVYVQALFLLWLVEAAARKGEESEIIKRIEELEAEDLSVEEIREKIKSLVDDDMVKGKVYDIIYDTVYGAMNK